MVLVVESDGGVGLVDKRFEVSGNTYKVVGKCRKAWTLRLLNNGFCDTDLRDCVCLAAGPGHDVQLR